MCANAECIPVPLSMPVGAEGAAVEVVVIVRSVGVGVVGVEAATDGAGSDDAGVA